ncbi:MAG: hypothetical protein Q8L35_07480 [Actinomycetota bacterium]|nr:hypothetical protein [Actinomycetota bacterium]
MNLFIKYSPFSHRDFIADTPWGYIYRITGCGSCQENTVAGTTLMHEQGHHQVQDDEGDKQDIRQSPQHMRLVFGDEKIETFIIAAS